jgi:hypothetical protein
MHLLMLLLLPQGCVKKQFAILQSNIGTWWWFELQFQTVERWKRRENDYVWVDYHEIYISHLING